MKLKSLLFILIASSTITSQSKCFDISARDTALAIFSGFIFAIAYDIYCNPDEGTKKWQEDCICSKKSESESSDDSDNSWRTYNPTAKTEPETTAETEADDAVWRDKLYDVGDVFNG